MNHNLKASLFFMFLILPMGALFAQTSSGVDADSRFIAIGVNGWHDASALYGGAETYFATDAMRDLGPSGDYSNIAAYHLIGSANADGEDYIRQIGDFNSSFDENYKNQPDLFPKTADKDSNAKVLLSNNQPFISMAKVEWVYRNTIDGEFLKYLSDKTLPGISRAVDVMISDGPQYKDLLSVGSPAKALDYIRRIRSGEVLTAAEILGDPKFKLLGTHPYEEVKRKMSAALALMGGSGTNVVPNSWSTSSDPNSNRSDDTLLVSLWLSAWDCPNTIRFFTHSMGGTDVLRYLSEPESKYDSQAHDGGLYQRNQDYTWDKFAQDLSLNSDTNLYAIGGTTWASRSDLSDADKYAIYKKERQNSVDKVITVDGPLAGTPSTDLVEAASVFLNEASFNEFKATVAVGAIANIFVSSIEIGWGVALVPFLPPVGLALIVDGSNCIVMDSIYLIADLVFLQWDTTTDKPALLAISVDGAAVAGLTGEGALIGGVSGGGPIGIVVGGAAGAVTGALASLKLSLYDLPVPDTLQGFPKTTDKFFPDTKPGSAHVSTYADASPATSYSNWPDRIGFKNEPVEVVNVVVTGPATYTKNPDTLGLSGGLVLGVYQRTLFFKLISGATHLGIWAINAALDYSTSPSDKPAWTETVLPVVWSLLNLDYEPGTFLTTQSYSSGVGSHSVGPIALNPNASVFELDATTSGFETTSNIYGTGFPNKSVWDSQTSSGDFMGNNLYFGIHPWDATLLSNSILYGDSSRLILKGSDLTTSHGGGSINTLGFSLKELKASNSKSAATDFSLEKDPTQYKLRNFYDYLMFGPPDVSTELSMKLVTAPLFGNILQQIDADPAGDPLKGLKSTYLVPASASDVGAKDYLVGLTDAIYNNQVMVLPVDIVNYYPGAKVAFSIDGSPYTDGEALDASQNTLIALGTNYATTLAPTPRLVTDPSNGRSLLLSPRFKEGFNEVVFKFTDDFGDVTYKDMQIVQITVPPFVKPVYPLMNQYVGGGTVHAQVQALDISGGTIKPQDWLTKAVFTISVDGNPVSTPSVDIASGTVSFDLTGLADGNHTVNFTVSTYGVTNTQSWRFWVDSSAPVVTFSSPTIFSNKTQTNNGNVGFFVQDTVPFRYGGITYPVDTVQLANLNVTVNGQNIWSGTNVRLGNYIEPWNGWNSASQLSTGRYPVVISATDRVGNTSTQTGEVIVDNQAPIFTKCSLNTTTVTLATGLLQLDYQLALNDWETTGKVAVTLHNTTTGEEFTLTTDSDGQNEAQYALTYFSQGVNSLHDGIYDIHVAASDTIGNQGDPVYLGSVVVDRTAPVVTNVVATPFELDAPNHHVDLSLSASESADVAENRSSVLGLDILLTDANGNVVASVPENKSTISSTSDTPTKVGFDLPSSLADGQYVFVVNVSDHNGNTSVEYVPVIVNAVPPLFTAPDSNALIDSVVAFRGTITNPKFANSLPFDHYEVWWQSGILTLPADISNPSASGWVSTGLSIPDDERNPTGPSNWGQYPVQAGNVFGSFDTTGVADGLVTVLVVSVQQGGYRIGTVRTFRVLHGSLSEAITVQMGLPESGTTLDTQPTTANPTPQITIPYSVAHDIANPVDVYASILDSTGRVVKQNTYLNLASTNVFGRPQTFAASGLYVYEDSIDGRFHLVFNNTGTDALQFVATVSSTAIQNITDGANVAVQIPALSADGKQLLLSEVVPPGTLKEIAFGIPTSAALQIFASGTIGTVPMFVGQSATVQSASTTLTLYAGSNYPPFVWDGTDQFGRVVVNGTYTASVEAYGTLAGHDVKRASITLTSPFVVDQVTLDTNVIQTGVSALSVVNGRFHVNKPASFQVLVLDSSGNQVNVATLTPTSLDNAGYVNFSWGAVDTTNALVPVGTYSFVILATPADTGVTVRYDAAAIPTLGNLQVTVGSTIDASLPATLNVPGDSTYNGNPVAKGNTDYTIQVTPKGQYLPDTMVATTLNGTGTQVVQAYPQLNYQVALRKNYSQLWSELSADSAHIQVEYYAPSGWWGVYPYSSTTQHSDYTLSFTQSNLFDAAVVSYDVNSNSISDPYTTFTIQASGQITIKDNYETTLGEYWLFGNHDINGNISYNGISAIDTTAGHITLGAYGGHSNSQFTSIRVLDATTVATTGSSRTLNVTVEITGHIWSDLTLATYLPYADGIVVAGPDSKPSSTGSTIQTSYVDTLHPVTLSNFVAGDGQLNPAFSSSDTTADCWRRNPSYYFYNLGEDYQNVTATSSPNLTGVPRQTPQTYSNSIDASAPRNLVNPGATYSVGNGKVNFVLGPSAGNEFGLTVTSSAEDRILYPYPADSAGFSSSHLIGDASLNIPTVNINGTRTSDLVSATPNYIVPEWLNSNSASGRNVWFTEQGSSAITVTKALTYSDTNGYLTSPITLPDLSTASSGLPVTANVKDWEISGVLDTQGHITFTGLVGSKFANDATFVPFKIGDTNISRIDNGNWDLTMDANVHADHLSSTVLTPDLDALNRTGTMKSLYFADLYPFPTQPSSNLKDLLWLGVGGTRLDNTSVVIPGKKDYSGSGSVGGYSVSLLGVDGQPYQGLTAQTPATFGKGQKLSDGVVVKLSGNAIRSLLAIHGTATSTFELSYLAGGQWQPIPIDGQNLASGVLTYWDVTGLYGVQTLRLVSHGSSSVNVAFTNVYIGTQVSDSSSGTNVASPSGQAQINFPTGSLSASSVVSIDSLDPQDVKDIAVLPAYAPIGKIVKLSPEGMTFPNAKPELQFTYNKADVDSLHIDPLQLVIYQLKDDGTLVPTPTVSLFIKVNTDAAGNSLGETVVWDSSQQDPAQFSSSLDYTYVRIFTTLNHFSYYVVYEGDVNRRPTLDQSDFLTNQTKVAISGTAEAGASVNLYVRSSATLNLSDPSVLPEATIAAGADGKFTIPDLVLPFEGDDFVFAVYATGTAAQYSKIQVSRDTTPPVVSASSYTSKLSPASNGTQKATTVYVSSNEGGWLRWNVQGANQATVALGTQKVPAGVSVPITLNGLGANGNLLADGDYKLTVVSSDVAGNSSVPVVLPFTINTVPTSFACTVSTPIISPANHDGYLDQTTFQVAVSKDATVSLWVWTSSVPKLRQLWNQVPTSAGTVSVVWDGKDDSGSFVPDGNYRLFAYAKDTFGNESAVSLDQNLVTVVNTPPALSLSIKSGESFIIPAGVHFTLQLSKSALTDIIVQDDHGAIVYESKNTFAQGTTPLVWDTSTLPPGSYTMSVTAQDDLRNVSSIGPVVIALQEDSVPPSIVLQDEIVLEASAIDTPYTVPQPTIVDQLSPITVTSDAPATFPLGTTIVTWTATDPYGLSSTQTQKITVRDTTAPIFTKLPVPIVIQTTSVHSFVDVGSLLSGAVAAYDLFPISVVNDSPREFFTGTTMVKWTATDVNGNVNTVFQPVSIVKPDGDTMKDPWFDENIGQATLGSATFDGSQYQMSASGHGVLAPNQTTFHFTVGSRTKDGYIGNVTLTNISGADINGWTLDLTLPDESPVKNTRNGTDPHNDNLVTIHSEGKNRLIPANGSITVSFPVRGTDAPSAISLNGVPSQEATSDPTALPSTDEFHFVYQKVTGDTTITVKVGPFKKGDTGAQAVLMLRDSLVPDSAMVAITANCEADGLGNGHHDEDFGGQTAVESSWRLPNSTTATSSLSPVGDEPYLRLTRVNNLCTLYVSRDGKSWSKVGAPILMQTSGPDYIGFGVRTISPGSTIKFSQVSISTPHPSSGDLADGWKHQDVGAVSQPGWAVFDGKNANIRGSGFGSLVPGLSHIELIKDSSDDNGYTGRLILTNLSPTTVENWKLGFVFPGNERITQTQYGMVSQDGREVVIRSPDSADLHPNETVEVAIRVSGTGDPFGFLLNGIPCTTGNDNQTPNPNRTVSSITKLSSSHDGYQAVLTFRNVSGLSMNGWTASFDFPGVEKILRGSDIGIVQTGNHVVVKSSSRNAKLNPDDSVSINLLVKGSGLPGNITVNGISSGNALLFDDATHLVYKPSPGDSSLVVKVLPYQLTPGAEDLLTVRTDLTGVSPMVSLFVVSSAQEHSGWFDRNHQTIQAYFGFRDSGTTGLLGSPVSIDIGSLGTGKPLYLKLQRKDNLYIGYYSFDGVRWMSVGVPYRALFGDNSLFCFGASSSDMVFDSVDFDNVVLSKN